MEEFKRQVVESVILCQLCNLIPVYLYSELYRYSQFVFENEVHHPVFRVSGDIVTDNYILMVRTLYFFTITFPFHTRHQPLQYF